MMRGTDDKQASMFSVVSPERRVPAGPPLRRIKAMADEILGGLSKTFDEAGWVRTVERMHDAGAEIDREGRAQVVAFLLAKNLFEAKCSTCHGTDRPLAASKSAADWLETVRRMSGKKPGNLSEAEAAGIAAYLAITRPLP